MNLKLIFQKVLLWFINLLYYPFVLGYYSDNDNGNYCITNKDCSKIRYPGNNQWQDWNNNPGFLRVYNEYVEVVRPKEVSLKTLWYLFQNDSKIQSRVYFANTFLWLESIGLTLRITTVLFSWPTDNLNHYYIHLSATLFVTAIFTLGDMLIKYITNRKQKEQNEI